jgi:lycopene cyclase-like protein
MTGSAIVVGAGPAGLATATALAERGVDVTVVDPDPSRGWPARYGMWWPQVEALGLTHAVRRSWRRPLVIGGETTAIDATYALLDNDRLREHLVTRFEAAGGRTLAARVREAHGDGPVEVRTDHGVLRADVVVDASGAASVVVGASPPDGWQSAYGRLVEVAGHPWSDDEMVLMDFRDAGQDPPTFLYAMPMGPRQVFVEETVLTSRQPLSFESLAARLDDRVAAMGLEVVGVLGEEHVRIPMGQRLARARPGVVALGSAAGLSHPATGYTVATSLELAPPLADAIADRLQVGDVSGAALAGWEAILPRPRRRSHQLGLVGHDVLEQLDGEELGVFMTAFFRQPTPGWLGFMSGASCIPQRFRAMWGMGHHLPWWMWRRILGILARMGPARLLGVQAPPLPALVEDGGPR